MTRRNASDWSLEEVHQRLCPACSIAPSDLPHLDFPRHDYETPAGRFWHLATLRTWVSVRAEAEIESRLSEVWELVAFVRTFHPLLSTAEARQRAISDWVKVRLKRVFDTG